MAHKGYLLVEGHGEVEAAGNLITRLWHDLGRVETWLPPRRWNNLARPEGLRKAAEYARSLPAIGALLILRDEDDRCPAKTAPVLATDLAQLQLPFPCALVLLKPEYEVLFLPCLPNMAGRLLTAGAMSRPGLAAGTSWDAPGSWEKRRDIKGWLSAQFPPHRAYKPTTDQLALTRMIDLPTLRQADVPCFGTLERALVFLADHWAGRGVYPPPVP